MTIPSEHDPSDPLRELASFHRRIRLALSTLKDLAKLSPSRVDPSMAKALVDFFRGPLLWHDIDEEAVLLPALKAAAGEPVLEGLLMSCSRAHENLESLIDAILPHLDEVAASLTESNPVLLLTASQELDLVLLPHLAMEEREVFPLARRLLNAAALHDVARELAARRDARSGHREEKAIVHSAATTPVDER